MAVTANLTCPACGDNIECRVELKLGPSTSHKGGGMTIPVTVASISGYEDHLASHQQ